MKASVTTRIIHRAVYISASDSRTLFGAGPALFAALLLASLSTVGLALYSVSIRVGRILLAHFRGVHLASAVCLLSPGLVDVSECVKNPPHKKPCKEKHRKKRQQKIPTITRFQAFEVRLVLS